MQVDVSLSCTYPSDYPAVPPEIVVRYKTVHILSFVIDVSKKKLYIYMFVTPQQCWNLDSGWSGRCESQVDIVEIYVLVSIVTARTEGLHVNG